ncbi:MAG TPA: ABC transporter ATP-binding protein [Stackebrandtia sp.]|jgi:peptide/nickel transport system ATP-binding protein|uniref:ABC transporter ATP-binding protein n=1 Tax=Stackebrandtia sp. TaxID=2023065 RepID=UPI002D53548A|nr:ABC transporter ATP-binding protein [Stackebrandtia sp.]HZE39282.1 ABC transporter ATP-binding protein [Stackebrandtia sp.]
MTDEAPLIALKNVSQVFDTKRGKVPAVRDVSLEVNAGDVLCLVGESGCGKTTTARMAAGLAPPSEGTVEFNGRDITKLDSAARKDYRKSVQFVHQDPYASLNPIRSVYGTLAAPLRKHGLAKNKKEAWAQAAALLERVDLTPADKFLPKYPHQMSGGQRQRVAVARSLSLQPKLIVADEATSMLDVSIRVGVLRTLTRLRTELNVGFVFITHDLAIARYFGTGGNIAVMYLGRVVEFGPTADVIANPQHPYTKALLAAVPEIDPEQRLAHDSGVSKVDIPSLTDLPTGCTFHPRCPLYRPGDCDTVEPNLSFVDAGREVACHVVSETVDAARGE